MSLKFEVQSYRKLSNDYEIVVTSNDRYKYAITCDSKARITELEVWNDLFEEFESVPLSRKKSAWYTEKLQSVRDDLLLVIHEYMESKTAI